MTTLPHHSLHTFWRRSTCQPWGCRLEGGRWKRESLARKHTGWGKLKSFFWVRSPRRGRVGQDQPLCQPTSVSPFPIDIANTPLCRLAETGSTFAPPSLSPFLLWNILTRSTEKCGEWVLLHRDVCQAQSVWQTCAGKKSPAAVYVSEYQKGRATLAKPMAAHGCSVSWLPQTFWQNFQISLHHTVVVFYPLSRSEPLLLQPNSTWHGPHVV